MSRYSKTRYSPHDVTNRLIDKTKERNFFCLNNLFLVLVFPIEGAFLLALLASDWRTVLLLRIGAPLALVANKGGNDVAVLAG